MEDDGIDLIQFKKNLRGLEILFYFTRQGTRYGFLFELDSTHFNHHLLIAIIQHST